MPARSPTPTGSRGHLVGSAAAIDARPASRALSLYDSAIRGFLPGPLELVGATTPAVIVIDEQGVVRHRHDHLLGLDYQSVDDLKAALDALPGSAA